jgi:glycosyltransferase involved in cell wall biosynthesis
MPGDLTVGIDATNLRQGGGRTHLVEVLRAADPAAHGFGRVVVWGSRATLDQLEDRPWLDRRAPAMQEGGLLARTHWQRFHLSASARAEGCDVLFVPGGSFLGDFRPFVTMSHSLLPFEWRELRRYGPGGTGLKFLLLRWAQRTTFRRAQGVIFLTPYAADVVQRVTGPLRAETTIIPHGLAPRFLHPPKPQRDIATHATDRPYRVIYVSNIDQYKHQWHVVEALAALRARSGWPLVLELVGPAYPPALVRLRRAMARHDPAGTWVRYRAAVPHPEVEALYHAADLGLFASSCENMPNILLETMASGLPIACSDRGPMPGILGTAGVYFDPEQPVAIARAVERLIADGSVRAHLAEQSFTKARQYKWARCADATFAFLARTRARQPDHR